MNTPQKEYAFPPASFEKLQAVAMAIQSGDLDLSMGRQSKMALSQMLDQPRLVAMSSITELADQLTVSPATLSRLSRLLGFDGFKALQKIFKSETGRSTDFYSRQAKKSHAQSRSHVEIQVEQTRQNLSEFEKLNDPSVFKKISQEIRKAKTVHCFGFRQSFMAAHFFSYGLGLIRQQVTLLNNSGQGLAYSLGQLRPNDLIIGFSFEPYSASTVRMLQSAKKIGVKVVAITDSHASPIARLGDHFLRVPSQTEFYSNSMVMPSLLVEIVLTQLAMDMDKKAVDQLEQREQFIGLLNDEY